MKILYLRIVFMGLWLYALGLPIVEGWKALLLLLGVVAIVYASPRIKKRNMLILLFFAVALTLLRFGWPAVVIEEGDNIFLYKGAGGVLERGLPQPVFKAWSSAFDHLFPRPKKKPSVEWYKDSGRRPPQPFFKIWQDAFAQLSFKGRNQRVEWYKNSGRRPPQPFLMLWRHVFDRLFPNAPPRDWYRYSRAPDELYAYNPDSFWRTAKYSRQVHNIAFHGLYEFRGGFVNNLKYNFWEGDMKRRLMPFWAMYEFDDHCDGSKIYWKGVAYLVNYKQGAKKITHKKMSSYLLKASDKGSRLYFLFLPEIWNEFSSKNPHFIAKDSVLYKSLQNETAYPSVRMDRPFFYNLRDYLINMFTVAMLVFMTGCCLRTPWPKVVRIVFICAISWIVLHAIINVDWGKNLGEYYPPHGGGDDGMLHDFWGVEIARNIQEGHWGAALEGSEPVYHFTPGLRYFRGLEKILFGSTNLGYLVWLVFYPALVFQLLRLWLREHWAWLLTLLFIVLPPNMNFSLSQYVVLARMGYPAPVATGAFLAAVVLLWPRVMYPKTNGEIGLISCFTGGLCLFISVFMRPNYAIPVVVMGSLFVAYVLYRKNWKVALYCTLGMAIGLLMPFHNVYFGNEFHLITGSPDISLPINPMDYWHALRDWLTGVNNSEYVAFAKQRLTMIAMMPPWPYPDWMDAWTPLGIAFRFVALCASIIVAFYPGRIDFFLRLLALAAVSCFPAMLIVFYPQPRYVNLGWDLGIMVLFIIVCSGIDRWRKQQKPILNDVIT